jgi:2-iminobutanoate/2-iminopropanoate deaminase
MAVIMTVIQPPSFSRPIGRYSPGIKVPLSGDRSLLFISGQVATDEQGHTVGVGDPEAQTRKVFENLGRVLQEAGGGFGDLVAVTIYVTDMANFAAVSRVRNEVFALAAPSSTFVEVKGLAIKEHLVEISAIAVISDRSSRPAHLDDAANGSELESNPGTTER